MNTHTRYLCIILTVALSAACASDDAPNHAALDVELEQLIGDIDAYRLPDSDDYERIPQDPNNPLTSQKIALGKLLFHETALGTDNTFSCASCHHAAAGFQANRVQGLGEGGIGFGASGEGRTRAANIAIADLDVQPIRTPSILNSGYQKVTLWNGQFGATDLNTGTESQWTTGTPKATNALGFEGLETQAIAGLEVHRLHIDSTLLDQFGYRDYFDEAFADVPAAERYTRTTAGLAIAAYERTVLANRAPFQDWLAGRKDALSPAAKQGAIVFFGDGACASCHNGPSLASTSFHALGMSDLHDGPDAVFGVTDNQAAHKGRGGFTMRSDEMFAFKTPQLYNLTDSRFYGHGASLRSLREVVDYKAAAQPENARVPAERLSDQFVPLHLSEQQRDDLVTFLEEGLYDPDVHRYTPDALPSGLCFPNADALSRADMNCD